MAEWPSNLTAGAAEQAGRKPPLSLTDAVLLKRCRDGDMAAFGQLIGRYQDRVYSSILRMCGNCDDAEELCQETFVKALENVRSFRQASGFYTWLFRIGMNLTISRRRRSGRLKFHSLEATPAGDEALRPAETLGDERQIDPHMAAANSDAQNRVLKALAELDEEFSVVVVLRDIEDMNYDQIAEVLEVPVGTVKSRLYRARSMLREKLQSLMD